MVQAKTTHGNAQSIVEQACLIAALLGGSLCVAASFNLFGARSAAIAGLGTGTAALAGVTVRELSRKDNLQDMSERLERTKTAVELATRLEAERTSLRQQIGSLQANLAQLQSALAEKTQAYTIESAERQKLQSVHAELIELQQKYKAVDAEFAQEAIDHELLKQEHQKLVQDLQTIRTKIEQLTGQNEVLMLANHKLEAEKANFEKIAKLEANAEVAKLKEKLDEWVKGFDSLEGHFNRAKEQYHALMTENQKQRDYYVAEFTELQEAAAKDIPQLMEDVLDERDQRILALMKERDELSAELAKPRKFDAIGEYTRADVLIDELLKLKDPLVVDAMEIDHSERHQFKAYYWLRNHPGGTLVAKALNELSEALMIPCRCLKPVQFECDPLNPHRISALFVHHKKARAEKASDLDWIPAEQFNRIHALLKKTTTRVMGAQGEGKGTFVNLLLAIEANQLAPAIIRLHDPMDGSAEDHWKVEKTSRGEDETTEAFKGFVQEVDERIEHKRSTPSTIDIFDEFDRIAARSDSKTADADLLNCTKGMRHIGMRAIALGQSPSVAKKKQEWADFDNYNAVYFGAAIKTCLDKNPTLELKKEQLIKRYQKLKDYCDGYNEEYGLEGWNEKRIGLLVVQGKAEFFELPRPDSIPCDWSKLPTSITQIQSETKVNLSNPDCPICGQKLRSNKDRWQCDNKNHTKEMGQKSWLKTNFEA